jgi:aminomethyltransferase
MWRTKLEWFRLPAGPCPYHTARSARVRLIFLMTSWTVVLITIVTAHNHVRTAAGLFDVSHMLQHMFTGPSAQDFLMSLTPSSLHALGPFSSSLSVLLNDEGGIIDDTIITKHSDDAFYVVTNAGRATEDKAHFTTKLQEWNAKSENKGKEVKWETLDGWGLVALQGPKSAQVLQGLTDVDLTGIKFGQAAYADIDGVKCHIARGGYTGEDGFEVSLSKYH